VRCDESAVRRKTSVIEGGEKRHEIGSWVGKIRSAESIVHILYQSLLFISCVYLAYRVCRRERQSVGYIVLILTYYRVIPVFLCYRAEDGVSVEADMFGTGWGLEMGGGWVGMLGE